MQLWPACYWCGNADPYITRDHLLRRSDRPPGEPGPVVGACVICNARRGHDAWVPYWVWSQSTTVVMPRQQLRALVLLGLADERPGARLSSVVLRLNRGDEMWTRWERLQAARKRSTEMSVLHRRRALA